MLKKSFAERNLSFLLRQGYGGQAGGTGATYSKNFSPKTLLNP
jgi:hypothetical protein